MIDWTTRARELRDQGMGIFQIAQHLKINLSHVRRLIDPNAAAASERWGGEIRVDPEPEPADFMTARSADARALAAWVRANVDLSDVHTNAPTVARQLSMWENSERDVTPFSTVDRMCNHFDLHPSQLPDEVWLHSSGHSGSGVLVA